MWGQPHEGSSPFARTIAKTQAPDFGSGLFCCGAVWLSSLPNTTTNVVVEFSPNYAIGERTCRTWLARPAEKRDPMNIKPSASIRQNYNEVAELCRATGEPVYLTKNGEGDLVVMDIASFSRREKMLALRVNGFCPSRRIAPGASRTFLLTRFARRWRGLSALIRDGERNGAALSGRGIPTGCAGA